MHWKLQNPLIHIGSQVYLPLMDGWEGSLASRGVTSFSREYLQTVPLLGPCFGRKSFKSVDSESRAALLVRRFHL